MAMTEAIIKTAGLPLKHQLGKLLLGTVAGFAATKLTEKGYDAVLNCMNTKKITTP
jgi:hypothetical protein